FAPRTGNTRPRRGARARGVRLSRNPYENAERHMRSFTVRWSTLAATGCLLAAFPMCTRDTSDTSTNTNKPAAGKSDSPQVARALPGEEAARTALANVPLGHV